MKIKIEELNRNLIKIQKGRIKLINLNKAKEEFEKYVKPYGRENVKICRKIEHSYRVLDVAEEIAKSLDLSEEDLELAKLIGLLHDIGRFEQIRIYNTFVDKDSIDHADLGVKILFEDNLIRKFIEDDKYDEIIYKAIKSHNKYAIENGLNQQELLHAKIIRDADKVDIYEVYIRDIASNENAVFNYDNISNEKITGKVLESVKKHELVNRYDTVNEADRYVAALAFVFDLNFKKGIELVKERKYIEKLINRVKIENNKDDMEMIEKNILEYLG